jgi:hypothetical protein
MSFFMTWVSHCYYLSNMYFVILWACWCSIIGLSMSCQAPNAIKNFHRCRLLQIQAYWLITLPKYNAIFKALEETTIWCCIDLFSLSYDLLCGIMQSMNFLTTNFIFYKMEKWRTWKVWSEKVLSLSLNSRILPSFGWNWHNNYRL